jgi:putative ABC transport system permease protein
LRSGRLPNIRDDGGAQRIAVISESLARREFPDESPIGKRFTSDLRRPKESTYAIVGIVRDTLLNDPRTDAHRACVYFPYRQSAFPPQALTVQVRVAPGSTTAAAIQTMRGALRDVDPTLAFYDVRTIEQTTDSLLAGEWLATLLTSFFGATAALLCALGIHGVVSRELVARAREAAIRIAVGASPRHVMWVLARYASRAVLIGLGCGALLLAGIAPSLQVLLSDVRVADPRFALAAVVVLFIAALSALALPSWRVRRIQPAELLRQD